MVSHLSVLLQPLYEIQNEIEEMQNHYKSNVVLNVLDDNFNNNRNIYAPKYSVLNFLNILSHNLYKFNLIKNNIQSEKQTKFILYLFLLIVSIIVVSSVCLLFNWGVLLPILTSAEHVIIKIKISYALIRNFILAGTIISLFSFVFAKENNKLKVKYQTNTIFSNEPSIQHLISMMMIKNNFLEKQSIHISGCNPILGFMVHNNLYKNVTYEYIPSKQNSKYVHQSGCLDKKKMFKFNDNMKNPYKLTEDSLLNNENVPCYLINNNDKKFVDPFLGDNKNVLGNPDVFIKKIRKFDVYAQWNDYSEAYLYFNALMLSNNATNTFNKSLFDKIKKNIIEVLNINGIIILNHFYIPSTYLKTINNKNVVLQTSKHDFLKNTIEKEFYIAYYDDENRNGYLFSKNDINTIVFLFSMNKKHSTNLTIIKSKENNNLNTYMNIGSFRLPNQQTISQNFNASISDVHDIQTLNSLQESSDQTQFVKFEATLDEHGNINNIIDGTVEKSTSTNPPEYKLIMDKLQNKNNINSGNVFVYRLPLFEVVSQNMKSNLLTTLSKLKPYFFKKIPNIVYEDDPSMNFSFNDNTNIDILNALQAHLKNNFKIVEQTYNDILTELPKHMKDKSKSIKLNKNQTTDETFISLDEFKQALKNMNEKEFLDKFLKNLEIFRSSTSGLKFLHEKFSDGLRNQEVNKIMFEMFFYIVLSMGFLEICSYIGTSVYPDYLCTNISFQEKEYEINKKNASQDDTNYNFKEEMKKLNADKNKYLSFIILKISLIFLVYCISCSVLYTWKEHSKSLYQYNRFVIEQNGNTIVRGTHAVFLFFIEKIKEGYFLQMNSEMFNSRFSGDIDEMYLLVHNLVTPNENKKINLSDSIDILSQYNLLVEILNSCYKCNYFVDIYNKDAPFPILDVLFDSFLIVGFLLLLVLAYFNFAPVKNMNNIIEWAYIKKLMTKDIKITPESYNFSCNDPGIDKTIAYNNLKYLVAAIIVIFAIVFALLLFKSTTTFNSSLFSSYFNKKS